MLAMVQSIVSSPLELSMRVVLATDFSSNSRAAADFFLALPFREPIDLDIITVLAPPMIWDAGLGGLPMDLSYFIDEERAELQKRIEVETEELRNGSRANGLRSVHPHVSIGPPAGEVLHLAQCKEAELIALGALGHSAIERVLLGSTSDYIATHSDVSTLVVRPHRELGQPPRVQNIILALSGESTDQRIVDWVRTLALPSNVTIHLVRVLQLNSFYRHDLRVKATPFWGAFLAKAQKQLEDCEVQIQSMGIRTQKHWMESGRVGEVLVDYAATHGCDLIVSGDSHSSVLTRVFLGSTSRYVLRHAACSVLVLRDPSLRGCSERSDG
jgi:nucleotide-binding universal stress UspA family protein